MSFLGTEREGSSSDDFGPSGSTFGPPAADDHLGKRAGAALGQPVVAAVSGPGDRRGGRARRARAARAHRERLGRRGRARARQARAQRCHHGRAGLGRPAAAAVPRRPHHRQDLRPFRSGWLRAPVGAVDSRGERHRRTRASPTSHRPSVASASSATTSRPPRCCSIWPTPSPARASRCARRASIGLCPAHVPPTVVQGGLGGGVIAPRQRFQCDFERPWLWVGPTVIEALDLSPRRCIWTHPQGSEPISITYTDVPLGARLVLYGGLDYHDERDPEGPHHAARAGRRAARSATSCTATATA